MRIAYEWDVANELWICARYCRFLTGFAGTTHNMSVYKCKTYAECRTQWVVYTHRKWNLIFREQNYIIVDFQTLANLLLNDLTLLPRFMFADIYASFGQCEC